MKAPLIKISNLLFLIAFSAIPASALSAPVVGIDTTVEKDAEVIDENGQASSVRVAAETVTPGEILYFTLTFSNSGDEAATNVKLDNPIPADAVFQPGSAWGENTDILYSIDGGKSFKKAANLTYQVGNETRTASPEQYNAIRWVVGEIPAGSSGSVGFSARVK